jgi:hypothetical protein
MPPVIEIAIEEPKALFVWLDYFLVSSQWSRNIDSSAVQPSHHSSLLFSK